MAENQMPASVIMFLSGSRRGVALRLSGDAIRIGTDPAMDVRLPEDTEPLPAPHHATLKRRGSTYELESEPGRLVWVNGDSMDRLVLTSGDVLEIGRDGAMLRFRQYPAGALPQRTAVEVFSDCLECVQQESDTLAGRTGLLLRGLPRDLATQTSRAFRIGTVAVLVALAGSSWALAMRSAALEERLSTVTRVAGLDELLEQAEQGEVTPRDLAEILAELEGGIASAVERLEAIEGQSGAIGSVVERATAATVFLQGSYGFRDPNTDRMVRLVRGPDGAPALGPGRQPMMTIDGEGPVLELFYTGTGFVATADGLILTNRHVALPWESEDAVRRLLAQGLEPVRLRFLAYLPQEREPFDVSLVIGSETADVAILRCSDVTADLPFLELSEGDPARGDEVVVMGYPLGLRALMARAGAELVEEIQLQGGGDFWSVARLLSERGYIGPLATRGIVGQLTERFVVYDAETTSGGSGGPVLGLDGRVIAINAAILPEFGGSNLGVPAAEGRALLEQVRAQPPESPRP